jgi:hypothetical protein
MNSIFTKYFGRDGVGFVRGKVMFIGTHIEMMARFVVRCEGFKQQNTSIFIS